MINKKRVNMNLPVDLVRRVVEYAELKGLNVTSAYIVLLNDGLYKNMRKENVNMRKGNVGFNGREKR